MSESDLFPEAPIPLAAQIDCVERELGKRRTVYRRLIRKRRMTREQASREIRAMRAVLETLQRLADRRSVATEQAAEEIDAMLREEGPQ